MIAEMHEQAVSPFHEVLAFETLWGVSGATAKSLVELFARSGGTPTQAYSVFASEQLIDLEGIREEVEQFFNRLLHESSVSFSASIAGTYQYPEQLVDQKQWPLELFYYRGNIELAQCRTVSVVGARKASAEGMMRAAKLAKQLVEHDFGIVSGLAAGIDTAAMLSAVEHGGLTIGVIGTPIDQCYPKENADLQEEIAINHLLLSQVPFFRYSRQPFKTKRFYFPARNVTMAALSNATVIVEASDTSGTLTQARACMNLGRPLFILNSCFEQPGLEWPHRFAELGAIRVRDIDDILEPLSMMGEGIKNDAEAVDED